MIDGGARGHDDVRERSLLYDVAIGLVYRRAGGAEVLGGANGVALAREVYQRSLVGTAQPGSWLEVPLLGEPGFDMNVYYRREQLAMGDRFSCGDAYGHQSLVDLLTDDGVRWRERLRAGSCRISTARERSVHSSCEANPSSSRRSGWLGAISWPRYTRAVMWCLTPDHPLPWRAASCVDDAARTDGPASAL